MTIHARGERNIRLGFITCLLGVCGSGRSSCQGYRSRPSWLACLDDVVIGAVLVEAQHRCPSASCALSRSKCKHRALGEAQGTYGSSVDVRRERPDRGQVAVAAVVIQAVSNNKLVRNVESDVGDIDRIPGRLGLSEDCQDPQAGRSTRAQIADEVGKREAGGGGV